MDRLTYKSSMGDYGCARDFEDDRSEICALRNALGKYEDTGLNPREIEELKRYKQLEENGLLLRLPCKVGDTVYISPFAEALRYRVASIVIEGNGIFAIARNSKLVISSYRFPLDEIGKTVFLNREEAEKALKERESK